MFHFYDFSCSQDKKEEGGSKDEEQPESADRKEHNTDGQTGEENIQSDTAVELAGEASEKDQAKEVHFTFIQHITCLSFITLDNTEQRKKAAI